MELSFAEGKISSKGSVQMVTDRKFNAIFKDSPTKKSLKSYAYRWTMRKSDSTGPGPA
jgi:hypothetical protein